MDESSRTFEESTQLSPALRGDLPPAVVQWKTAAFSAWHLERITRLFGILLIFTSGIGIATGKNSLALFAGALMIMLVIPRLLPVTYRLTGEGIYQSVFGHRRFKPWSDFRSAEVNNEILRLTSRSRLTRGRMRMVLSIPLNSADGTVSDQIEDVVPYRLRSPIQQGASSQD